MGVMNWKKIKDAEVYGKGSYLPPDEKFLLTVQKTFSIDTRDKGSAFIVDFTVNATTSDDVPVGAKKNWYQGLRDESVAFSSIKEFMLMLLDIDQSDEDAMEEFNDQLPELMELVSDEGWKAKPASEHPLHGRTIGVETQGTITKKEKKDFTRHTWHAWDGEDDESFDF